MFGRVARSRLLPMSLPFRYFGAAAFFHVAAWAGLFFAAPQFVRLGGGLGPVFGALRRRRAGAAAGLAGALVFASFFVFFLTKVRHHGIQPPHQPATA